MQLYIKNNNLYYYHYPIFNGELSYMLFAILMIIIYFNRHLIKYLSYACIGVFLVGNYDSYLKFKQFNLFGVLIGSAIFHSPFLYPLINFKRYFRPNIIQFFILFFAFLIIHYLPYWPYLISRVTVSFIFLFVYLICMIIYKLVY